MLEEPEEILFFNFVRPRRWLEFDKKYRRKVMGGTGSCERAFNFNLICKCISFLARVFKMCGDTENEIDLRFRFREYHKF